MLTALNILRHTDQKITQNFRLHKYSKEEWLTA